MARAEDWSGPWLWALDVERKRTRRVTVGLEQFTSVSASRNGRRVVATVANPTANLWRVPVLDRLVEERDAQPFSVQTERALAPRFGGETLFFLSLAARGTGDGLWSIRNGQTFEVRRGADGVLAEPPAASPDGSRVGVVVRQQGKRRIAVMSADGTNSRTLAPSIEVKGVAGQGMADWSPDGAWIVTGGNDGQGEGLFKIPVDGGPPERLVSEARGPVWSPNGDPLCMPPRSPEPEAGTPFAVCDRMALRFNCRRSESASAEPTASCGTGRAWCTCPAWNPRTSGWSTSPRARSVSSPTSAIADI